MSWRRTATLLSLTLIALGADQGLAHATQVQCGSTECPNGARLRVQSVTNVESTSQNPERAIVCTGETLEGEVITNQLETVEAAITADTLSGCTDAGLTADISTNASSGWRWQFQQPDANGQVTIHQHPKISLNIFDVIKIQIFGGVVATCVYSSSSRQYMGTAQDDVYTLEGHEQSTLTERSGIAASECGTVNTTTLDMTGSYQIETQSGALAVVVHMT